MTPDRAALLAWNAAQQRARDEYRAYPIAACRAQDCIYLADRGSHCRYHRPKDKR